VQRVSDSEDDAVTPSLDPRVPLQDSELQQNVSSRYDGGADLQIPDLAM
jgi:hypothetical protein